MQHHLYYIPALAFAALRCVCVCACVCACVCVCVCVCVCAGGATHTSATHNACASYHLVQQEPLRGTYPSGGGWSLGNGGSSIRSQLYDCAATDRCTHAAPARQTLRAVTVTRCDRCKEHNLRDGQRTSVLALTPWPSDMSFQSEEEQHVSDRR